MSHRERFFLALVLLGIAILVVVDVVSDLREGALWGHVVLEVVIGLGALLGILVVLRGTIVLRHRLESERREFSEFRREAETWRAEGLRHVQGLAQAIDLQLERWGLSDAEKEVAFLLLKGLSLKEIAEIRKTTEKTARVQSAAIYAKAGLGGRAELSAFFLEDLLPPRT